MDVKKKYKCEKCNEVHKYEPAKFGHYEMPAPRFCERCLQIEIEAEKKREEDQIHKNLIDDFNAVCPIEMQRTDLSFSGFPIRKYEKVISWKSINGRGLVIHGDAGTCKTRSMWGLFKALTVKSRREAMMYKVGALQRELRDSYKSGNYERLFKKVTNVNYLFMDDLLKENLTRDYEAFLFQVFNERFENHKPIVTTINHTGKSMIDRFCDPETGKAFVDRLRRYCDTVKF